MSDARRAQISVKDGLAVLRLTRPEKRNAIDDLFVEHMLESVEEIANNPQVRVILLGGDGPSFCAGFDLNVLKQFDAEDERKRRFVPIMRARLRRMSVLLERLSAMEPVTVAAVNGSAAGGGFSLALACDFRVISESAQCWFPEVALGSALSPASTVLLTRIVPPPIAKDIILSCRKLGATEMLRLGLANEVAEETALTEKAEVFARRFLDKPSWAMLASKATVNALTSGQPVLRPDLLMDREDPTG